MASKFPKAYINDTGTHREQDPMMKRVDIHHAEIGSRPSGMPKGISNSNSIEHVGGTAGSK